MKVSAKSLLFTLGFLCTGCFCLPYECQVMESRYLPTVIVDCDSLGLVTVPSDIPSKATRFDIAFNNIRNVTYLPPLPHLYTLDLSYNSIESVSWMSLQTLSALSNLLLQGNRLKYVKLDIVIAHLPKLKFVNLSMNKLASFSQYALGWPQVTEIAINHNRFHCDCDLSWLIIKMTCLQACKGKDKEACCSSCSACFLINIRSCGRFDCNSPSQLHGRHLSAVSTQLTDCGGTTHQARTKVKSVENGTFRINGTGNTTTQSALLKKEPYENNSSARISTSASPTSASTSAKSIDTKEENNGKYIVVFMIEKCLTVAFIACLVLLIVRNNRCCNRREDTNKYAGHHSIHLHQIVPPIENISYNETVAGGSNPRQPAAHQITHQGTLQGLNQGHLVTSGEDQNTPSLENPENQTAGGLNHESVAVSNNTELYGGTYLHKNCDIYPL